MSRKIQYDHNFKILLIGAPAVGKTSLVNRFVHGKMRDDYVLTIGMEPYTKYEKVDGKQLCYTIFDIAGTQQFSKLRQMFFRGSKGALVVFDLTRKDTFDSVQTWLEDAKAVEPDQIFILVGNKADLDNQRKVKKTTAERLAKKLGCLTYIETSAKTGKLVNIAFNALGAEIIKHL